MTAGALVCPRCGEAAFGDAGVIADDVDEGGRASTLT